jgi:CobQ-like glutamine amidotransferase family enzyme
MTKVLQFAHLYPDLLNLYADSGNIRTLVNRCRWRDIEVTVHQIPKGAHAKLTDYHLVLLGGGSDREQELVGQTLRERQQDWKAAVEDGLPLLAVCGGYQLLGQYYQLLDGRQVPGLGILDLVTEAKVPRLIGNIAIDTDIGGLVMGFENHGGRTTHHHDPLGKVRTGQGNNGLDRTEGVHYRNVVGTYIHGPLLPKNPALADYMLTKALEYAGEPNTLQPLDDDLEKTARQAFMDRRINPA